MFVNNFQHALDAKGRVAIPKEYRKVLATRAEESLILTPSLITSRRWLRAYPLSSFATQAEKLKSDALTDPEAEDYIRVFFASSVSVPVDGQGRILIPPRLRELAGMGREVAWVGMWDWMEIWDRAEWEKSVEASLSDPEHLGRLLERIRRK